MNMVKRSISLLLALVMTFSFIPTQVLADETEPYDYGVETEAVEETLYSQVQTRADELLLTYLGSTSMSKEEIISAIDAMDGDTYCRALDDVLAMLDLFRQLTAEELQQFGVDNPAFVVFAEKIMEAETREIMVYAASGSVLSGEITVTDTASRVSVSGNNVTVTVKGSGGLTSGSTSTNTVTVTNTSGSTALISFDYNCTADGTYTFSHSTPGSYSGMLAAGESVTFTMTATGGALFSGSTATLTLSNFKLTKAKDASNVTVGFNSTMGSVTAGGSAVSDGMVLEGITPSEGVALSAAPAGGYGFACWVNAADNSILSYEASYTLQPEGDIAVKAMFYKIGADAYFSINRILYCSLNEALQVAQAGDVVMLANNGTLVASDYTIPSGITLLIPFNEGGAVYTTVPASTSATTAPSAYRTLTMAEGANLIIDGVMSVPAKHNRSSGRPVEKYGYVVMQKGSSIKVNGALYAYGFISGQGTVKIMSGASVYEYFQIIDFRGGTATLNMYNNSNDVFPLSQYYVQNVEAPMTLEAGASEYGYTTLYMSSTEYHSTVKFIGTSGAMFNLTSGSVTKWYDGTTDRLNIKANGTMSLDPMSLSVSTMSINSNDYVLPINSSITIEVEGGTATINQDLALQPDAKLIIREGAKCVLSSGVRLYVYDFDQWGNYVYSNAMLRVVPYAAGRTYKSATSSSRKVTGDAGIQVAGTLDASSGKLYTTESGAAITGVEGGTVKMASVSAGSTYQATQSGTSVSYATIAVTSAKLCNAAGDYVATSANTYVYEEGTWAVECEHSYTSSRVEATCTADGSITQTCSKCGRSRYETISATGHSWNDGEITTPADCETPGVMTFTCAACAEQYTEQIDALGHDMVYTPVKEATCTEAGESASAYCGRCDYVEVSGSIIPALGHDWSVTSRVEVTCTTDGSISYDCSRCDETKVETTKATGHQYSSVVAEPTCTEDGYTTHTCSACGDEYVDNVIPKTGHDYGDGSVVQIATCTDDGLRTYTCANCGDSYDEVLAALGHNLEHHALKLASYTSIGWDAYDECSRCDYSTYQEYPILSRQPVSDYETFMKNLLILEQIADGYVEENPGQDPVALVLNYIRTGISSYTTASWKIMAGDENTDFTAYVLAYEDAYNTLVTEKEELISVVSIRDVEHFAAPSDPEFELEFTHMFGTMDITKHNQGSEDHADVAGWSGDLVDLLDLVDGKRDVTEKETVEAMVEAIFTGDYIAGEVESFGRQDMYGDLDAFYIMNELEKQEYYSGLLTQIMRAYFVQGLEEEDRAAYFIANRLNGVTNRKQLRELIYAEYAGNKVNMTLEGTRTFASDSEKRFDLRMACCYAFADYLWRLAGDYVEDAEQSDLAISSGEAIALAPGIVRQNNSAQTADGKTLDYYVTVADLNRDDVRIDSALGEGTVLALVQGYDANVIVGLSAGAIGEAGSYADSTSFEKVLSGTALVQDGVIVAANGGERTAGAAAGITRTGKAVFAAVDSATQAEMAQIMLNAGCVTAVLLDSGANTSFVSRMETEDVFTDHANNQTEVTSVLMMISDAPDNGAFDHAVLNADYTYLTVNAGIQITAVGATARGTEVEIPEGELTWSVSDGTVGAVDANGRFAAASAGETEVSLSLNGKQIGSITLHVVTPDTVYFTRSNINAFYGEAATLPLAALYNRKPVAIAPNAVTFAVSENDEGISGGAVTGFDFIGDEASGLKTVTITASLAANPDVNDTISVTMYHQGDVVFDFNQITGGDRQLAWVRKVSNAVTEDDNTYYVVDPDEPMIAEYTLAIDMSAIAVPEQLKDLTSMLPGADSTDGTAWSFLLKLADRVSDLSEVRAQIQFDPNCTVDLSNLSLQNEYFNLTDVSLDEDTNILTVVLRWRKQSSAIDPATANPVCVVSGIRQTPREDAAWDSNSSLTPVNSGTLSYQFYLSAGALYTFANDEANQETYGLMPYINPDNSSDRGAYFGSDYASFTDSYTLVNALKNGWYFEDGRNVFYVDGVAHTEHRAKESIITEPSCTAGGYTSNVCEICGVAYITDEKAPLGHDRGDDHTDIHSFTCVNCGETITEDHDFTHSDVCICGLGTARNTATGDLYCTVTEALAAADAGQTVIMQGDSVENRILVRPGVTLDLNGHTLGADYVVGFNTSKICDSTNNAENGYAAEGLLKVNPDNMVIYEGNGPIPVYSPEKGGYIFVDFLFNTKLDEQEDSVYLNMLVTSRTMEAVDLMKDGAADNDIQVVVRLTWDNDTGTAYQDFVFNETTIQNVMSSNDGTFNGFSRMFYVKITGLKGMAGVTCTTMVISGANAADLGKTVTLGENA